MAEEEVKRVPADKHTIIIVILAVLLLGSLSFSIFVMLSEGKEEEQIIQMPGKGDDSLPRLLAEKQRLEEEKAGLEKEKQILAEKKSSLEKQLIEEIQSRPVFNVDKESPFDHVQDSQVRVLPRKVEIDLEGVTWWTIKDTNSMDPLLDIGSTALSIKPRREDALNQGDVALYDSPLAKTIIIHRIIRISADQQGWYSNFKGDNLEEPDPENVRFPQIKGVVVGIIY